MFAENHDLLYPAVVLSRLVLSWMVTVSFRSGKAIFQQAVCDRISERSNGA